MQPNLYQMKTEINSMERKVSICRKTKEEHKQILNLMEQTGNELDDFLMNGKLITMKQQKSKVEGATSSVERIGNALKR